MVCQTYHAASRSQKTMDITKTMKKKKKKTKKSSTLLGEITAITEMLGCCFPESRSKARESEKWLGAGAERVGGSLSRCPLRVFLSIS